MSTEKMHLGIYGILVENGRILLIKKSRGPYVGKLDLPGGKLEHGEDLEAALKRELKEETGVIVNNCQLITNMTATVEFEYEGEQINMYHVGLIYKIINSDNENLIAEMNLEDSFGAEWVDISSVNLNNLSPFAKQVIDQKLYEN